MFPDIFSSITAAIILSMTFILLIVFRIICVSTIMYTSASVIIIVIPREGRCK